VTILPAATAGPDPFDPAAVDDDTRAFNEDLERRLAAAPPAHLLGAQQVRAARERGETIWGAVVTVPEARPATARSGGRSVPVRVIPAAEGAARRGVYLHLHGGGWTLGAAHHADLRNRQVSRLGFTVVSVDYRLAPEHPYPAAPDDCETAARWLLGEGAAELGGGALLIGGESAGAHLALITLLRLRESDQAVAFAGANLVYGCYDLGLTPSAARWGERNLVLSTPIVEWFFDCFVPAERRRDPDVSPLWADLAGLPPALLTVGTLDPLLDDSLFLHARLRAAGNASELAVYPGGVHGFNGLPLALGARANRRIDSWLAAHAGGG
jgi:acetyl esterase